jgi:magnesium transporter
MPKYAKDVSRTLGLPPGSLVHIGEQKLETPLITIFSCDVDHCAEKIASTAADAFVPTDRPGVLWINVDGLHDTELIARIGQQFHLHPLVLEDILNTDQRPKLEDYESYLLVVLKMLTWDEKSSEILAEQVSLVLGKGFVLSFQEEKGSDVFNPVREALRAGKGRLRKSEADFLAYSLMDAVVDNYFVIMERLGDNIEELEDELVTGVQPQVLRQVHQLRRENIFLRKSVWPMREVVGGLERGEFPLMNHGTRIYLRDLYDHTIQVMDTVETFRDMLGGMLDLYLSSVSFRLNQVMKVLTIIATIFIPLTFLAGLWGMNFHFMPELRQAWGYPAALLLMAVIAGWMLYLFKKNKWI